MRPSIAGPLFAATLIGALQAVAAPSPTASLTTTGPDPQLPQPEKSVIPVVNIAPGFLSDKGDAYGRPVGVAVDRKGAVLVADDVGNTIWRISRPPELYRQAITPLS